MADQSTGRSRVVQRLTGACAWLGDELADRDDWRFTFTGEDLDELDRALAQVSGVALADVDRSSFPLQALAGKLAQVSEELENGSGVAQVRGLPVERWPREQLHKLLMGIGSYLGTAVFQDPHGQLLREIRAESGDVGARYGQLDTGDENFLSSRARTASPAPLRFHTDRCDIVGLLCLGQAHRGGLSQLASSVAVHNTMLERRPELAAVLYEDLPRSRMGEEVGGENLWYPLPVWGVRDGRFTSHYSRTYVEAGQLLSEVPRVSDEQWQALDLLAEIATEQSYAMRLEPGDLQFINNHVIYHARDAFEDRPESGEVRCLARVWLCSPGRALPPGHEVLWRAIERGELRGGIGQAKTA